MAWDHGECTTCVLFVVLLLLCTGDLDQYTYLQLFGCCCLWFVVVYTLVRVAASFMCWVLCGCHCLQDGLVKTIVALLLFIAQP